MGGGLPEEVQPAPMEVQPASPGGPQLQYRPMQMPPNLASLFAPGLLPPSQGWGGPAAAPQPPPAMGGSSGMYGAPAAMAGGGVHPGAMGGAPLGPYATLFNKPLRIPSQGVPTMPQNRVPSYLAYRGG